MRPRALLAVLWIASVACGPPPPGTSVGAAPRPAFGGTLLREDRVTLTQGSVVRAVGVGRRWVYAATPGAIIVYDRDRRAWLPPFVRDGGFDPSLVRRIGVDPDDDSAWLITAMGAFTLQPLTAFVTRAPAGPLPQRLRIGSLESVYREFPSVQAFEQLLTRGDAALQAFPVVAGARAPDRTEVWLGTFGGGLYQVDPLFNRADPRQYGLAASGVGAIARAADGVWVAPAPRAGDTRSALVFVSRDAQQFRWLDDAARRGFGGARATALAAGDGVLWMGTTNGLYRVPTSGDGMRAFGAMSGLPSDVVLSVLPRAKGVWVGTDRGLGFLATDSADLRGHAIAAADFSGVPVRALLATGDTLWVGTDVGVVLRPPGEDDRWVRPVAASEQPRLRQGVRALTNADSQVFVALSDALLAFNLRDGQWREPWPAAPWRAVGQIDALSADARTVWAGGPFGVIAVNRANGGSRLLRLGSDLPDAVTAIVLDGPWAWIGTLGGVVRVRRSSDGLFP
ncbi:MAG: hypothetical protein HYV19_12660 [Gemmatimonadetes bacterium]|nr:hypothetical protein [Gemmatimonadota bacterium]